MAVDYQNSSISPSNECAAVTPDDTNKLGQVTRGIYVGGAGNVVVDTVGGNVDITFAAVPAGTILPVRAIRVKEASTATNMVAMF